MDEVVAKYDGSLERALQESPRLREVMEKSSDFINQSTTEGFKKSNFSKTEFGQKAQAAANLHITTNLLSDLKTKYGGKTDSATAYQANQDYLGVLSKIRDKVISMISRAVPKSEMTHYRDIMDEAYDMSYKKGDRPAAALRAKEILQDILDRKARANGIEIIADKRYMKMNDLCVIHGHEYVGGISAPVNPARGLFLKGKVSCIQGHNHQTSEHTEPTMTGKMVTTWSLGCMSELHPAYMPLNKWNHGFAVVDLDDNGLDFEVRNKRVLKGKVL